MIWSWVDSGFPRRGVTLPVAAALISGFGSCNSAFRSPGGFVHAFQDDVHYAPFIADAGRIPDTFAALLGRVAPRGLATAVALLDHLFGFAQHDRDLFVGMQSVADEERDHDDALR